MGTRSRLTCWGSTAATSPPHPSYRQGLPSTSSLCLTMPTRGRASLCATKSTRPVCTSHNLCCFLFPGPIVSVYTVFLSISLFLCINIAHFTIKLLRILQKGHTLWEPDLSKWAVIFQCTYKDSACFISWPSLVYLSYVMGHRDRRHGGGPLRAL